MQLPVLNKFQRGTLFAAAAIVAIVQLIYFDENGVEGMGWILSVILITAVCLLGFRSAPQAPGFRVSWTGEGSTVSTVNGAVERNVAAITRAADNISARVRNKFPEVESNKGPWSAVTASMMRSSLLMYGLGLLSICKLRHDGNFLQSPEYRDTKHAVAKAAASSDNVILQDAAPESLATPAAYAGELREVEAGVHAFFRALAAHQTATPTAQLNKWLDDRSAIATILTPSMEAIARDEMRLIHRSLFGKEPA